MFPYIQIPSYKLGPFTLQAFGMLVATGVIIGSIITRRRAERLKLDVDIMIDSYFWMLPGGFMLSHWFSMIAYEPEKVLQKPLHLLYFWEGISSFGGILGGLLIGYFYYRYRKVDPIAYLDAFVYGFVPAFMFGRFGCTIAHDHPGMWVAQSNTKPMLIAEYGKRVIELPGWDSPALLVTLLILTLIVGLIVSQWREKPFFEPVGIVWMGIFAFGFYLAYPQLPAFLRALSVHWPVAWSEVPQNQFAIISAGSAYSTKLRYDLGLIEAILFLFFSGIYLVLGQFGKSRKVGFLMAIWFVLYAPPRYFLDFLRTADTMYSGYTPGHLMAIVMLCLGLWLFWRKEERRWDGSPVHPVATAVETGLVSTQSNSSAASAQNNRDNVGAGFVSTQNNRDNVEMGLVSAQNKSSDVSTQSKSSDVSAQSEQQTTLEKKKKKGAASSGVSGKSDSSAHKASGASGKSGGKKSGKSDSKKTKKKS